MPCPGTRIGEVPSRWPVWSGTRQFGAGIDAENTSIEIEGKTAIIRFSGSENDQITVDLAAGSLNVAFADGTFTVLSAQPQDYFIAAYREIMADGQALTGSFQRLA